MFNSLIFDQFWHLSLLSQLTSFTRLVLQDLIGEYSFFTELFHFNFCYFVVLFFSTLGGTITSHHMLLRFYNKRTLINRGESGWILRTPPLGTRHRSNKATISFGVPQVSVLGPLLFFLYVNHFHQCSTKLKFYLFADDTNIIFAEKNWKFLKRLSILNWANSTTG